MFSNSCVYFLFAGYLLHLRVAEAFQASINRHRGSQLAASNDGGMDAFSAQLRAAHDEAAKVKSFSSSSTVAYANEIMNESRSAVTAAVAAKHHIHLE